MTTPIPKADAGTSTIELVLLAPVFVALLLFVVAVGRITESEGQVQNAAADAARAASVQRTTMGATQAAEQTVAATLADQSITCANLTTSTDVSAFTPGGIVKVSVTCTTNLSDLLLSGFPGAKTFTATAAAPIDLYQAP